jgi:transposase
MTLTLARGGAKSDRHTTRHADQVEPPQAVMVGPTQAVRTSHRGYAGDPLYRARRTLHTGEDLLTDRQRMRLVALFAVEDHVEVEATWGIYQRMITAYRDPDRARGRELMHAVIDALRVGVPAALTELLTLGRTLTKRAADVLAYFDRPGTSNGPTEALNGRLEHLRGSALGFRNLTNYIARSLLETGGFRPRLHPRLG